MEEIENREQDLIQHIRTAGLQKRREIALVDEVLELRKEKRKLFSALYSKLANVTSEHALLSERAKNIVEQTQGELASIKKQYEDKFAVMKEQLHDDTTALEEENRRLKEHVKTLKENQDTLTAKYTNKVHLLEDKIRELAKLQRVAENTLRQDIEATLRKTLSHDIALQYEGEVVKLKEAMRAMADREADLKSVYNEQKVALKAYQADNENLKQQCRRTEANVQRLQAEVYEHKLSYEKLQMRVSGLDSTIAAKDAELVAKNELHATAIATIKAQHDKELETIAARVKTAMGKKNDAVVLAEQELEKSERERRKLEAALDELSRGLMAAGPQSAGGSGSLSSNGSLPPPPQSNYSRYRSNR